MLLSFTALAAHQLILLWWCNRAYGETGKPALGQLSNTKTGGMSQQSAEFALLFLRRKSCLDRRDKRKRLRLQSWLGLFRTLETKVTHGQLVSMFKMKNNDVESQHVAEYMGNLSNCFNKV